MFGPQAIADSGGEKELLDAMPAAIGSLNIVHSNGDSR